MRAANLRIVEVFLSITSVRRLNYAGPSFVNVVLEIHQMYILTSELHPGIAPRANMWLFGSYTYQELIIRSKWPHATVYY